ALPPELQVQLADAMCWRTLYGRRDVEEAISKVHRVSFHQHINLLGVMEAVPVSSGFALGSANWILRTDNEKVIYVADSSLSPGRHPQPLDNTLFSNCDMMIMTSLSPEPQYPPEAMVQELCNLVGAAALFPGGIIFDLIEVLHSYLQTAGHPRHTPLPAIDAIIQALAERGIRDVHVENKPQKRAMVLTVDSLSASVLLSPTKTKITTTDEQARQLLLDIITSRTLSLF
ncbi:integrator complex subunit 9, putative, partial [Acanthamoeba castellanii str. Neff]